MITCLALKPRSASMGNPSQEYRTDNDEVQKDDPEVKLHQSLWTVTNYVEAQTGKEFTIKLDFKHPYKLICERIDARFYVDGEKIRGKILVKEQFRKYISSQIHVRGPKTTTARNVVVQPMKFTRIETSKFVFLSCTIA